MCEGAAAFSNVEVFVPVEGVANDGGGVASYYRINQNILNQFSALATVSYPPGSDNGILLRYMERGIIRKRYGQIVQRNAIVRYLGRTACHRYVRIKRPVCISANNSIVGHYKSRGNRVFYHESAAPGMALAATILICPRIGHISAASVENAVNGLLNGYNSIVTAICDNRRIGMEHFRYALYMYGVVDRDIKVFRRDMVYIIPQKCVTVDGVVVMISDVPASIV